jgi:glycosyltransferase involved in cell wall biosynthesis
MNALGNILHLAKFYPPEWGGMESVTQDLAIATQAAGHTVTVVAFTKSGPAKREIMDNVLVERAPAKTLASQPLSLGWVQRAITAVRDADIVHIHLPNMLAAIVLPFVPAKAKVVLHWHSDVVGKGVLSRLTRPLEYALARRANAIIATSDPYAKASAVLNAFSDKVNVIPLGIHDPATAASSFLPDGLKSFIAGRRVLLSVGRLVPYKGFGYLIDAMDDVESDCCLIIVGGGELSETLSQDIASKNLHSTVMLAGKVPLETLNALFKTASVYVMPSTMRSEAFGVVLLEAMAHGLPVIATECLGSIKTDKPDAMCRPQVQRLWPTQLTNSWMIPRLRPVMQRRVALGI